MNLQIINLDYEYKKNSLIFENFNWELKSNLNIIQGPSGCGKTTLMKIIFGVTPPRRGQILFDKKNVKKFMVLQEVGLFPWMSGIENLKLLPNFSLETLENHSLYNHVIPILNKKVYEMSFGQRRKIELLRAFLAEKDILILDEPFNYIDKESREVFSNEIYRQTKQCMVLMSTHYSEDLRKLDGTKFYFPADHPITQLQTGADSEE
jgi:ABC-type multidrug transport system ATPase subunit